MLEACGRVGVVHLKLGALEVSFKGDQRSLPEVVSISPVVATAPSTAPSTEPPISVAEELARDRERERELSHEELMDELAILDPAAHEELIEAQRLKELGLQNT